MGSTDRAPYRVLVLIAVMMLPSAGCRMLGTTSSEVDVSAIQAERSERAVEVLRSVSEGMGVLEYGGFTRARATVTDRWSSLLQILTEPLAAREQTFRATFDLRERSVRIERPDAPPDVRTVGIKSGLAYTLRDGQRVYAPDSALERYLGTLQGYFELPLLCAAAADAMPSQLVRVGEIALLEPAMLAGETYDRVALRPPDTPEGAGKVVWIDRADGRVRWVEVREAALWGMTRRAVHFVEYEVVGGVAMPRVIEVQSEVGPGDPMRRIEFSDIELD